jgi:hypothetical protein
MADYNEQTKAELIAQLSEARMQMSRHAAATAEKLDMPRNFRRSFARNKAGWLAGAAASGVLISLLPGRRKKEKSAGSEKAAPHTKGGGPGMLLGLLKFSASLARPAIAALAKDKLGELIRKRRPY